MKTIHERAIEMFDEKYGIENDEWEIEMGIPSPHNCKSFISQIIDMAQKEKEEEIVKWLRRRCKANAEFYGTDKWNYDLLILIDELSKKPAEASS